ncbi:hypothetical protein [Ornithinimicrobium kibberense]|uniref:hypothetical protein n=1 Tax=Ornithinimicrobium kibberense TaxID=282060 RepID=UPI00361D650F
MAWSARSRLPGLPSMQRWSRAMTGLPFSEMTRACRSLIWRISDPVSTGMSSAE